MGLFNINNGTITDWLDQVVGGAELSEEAIARIKKASVKEAAVRTAVGLIADLISGCEVKVIEDGKPVRNDIWYLLNVSANDNETSAQTLAKWVMKMYYDGQSIIVPLAHKLFVADSFEVDEHPIKGDLYKGIIIRDMNSNRSFRADKIYVLRQSDPRIKVLIDEVCEVYAELLEYAKKAYSQNSGEKYVFQTGNRPSGDTEEHKKWMEMIRENLSSFVSAESAAYPLQKDQSLQRLSAAGTSTSSTDYPALRKEVYSVVSEILHLPGGLLEGNITSVDQIVNEALTFAIDPVVNMMNQELTRKTFSRDDVVGRGCHIKIDTTSIKHVDVLDMANNIDKLISSGFMSIDEVRAICDAQELNEEWSQKHYITKNYTDIEKGDELDW